MDKNFTITEAAEMLGVHPNTLRRWDRLGILESNRYGNRGDRRYSKQDLDKLIAIGRNRFKGPRVKDQPNIGVCIAVINNKNQILLGKRDPLAEYGANEFCFPAGRIAFGESPAQAAQKELKEKTGLTLPIQPYCTVYSTKYLVDGFHSFAIGFIAHVVNKDLANLQPGWQFYDIKNLPKPLFDVNKQVIKMIAQKKHFNF